MEVIVDFRGTAEHARVQKDRERCGFEIRLADVTASKRLPQHLQKQRGDHRIDIDAVDGARDARVEQCPYQRTVVRMKRVVLASPLVKPGDEHLARIVIDRLVLEHRVIHTRRFGDVEAARMLLTGLVPCVVLDGTPRERVDVNARPSVRQQARCVWAADWPYVDHTCITLCSVYRKIRKKRVRSLARSIRPLMPETGSVRHSPESGLLLCEGKTPAQSIALLGRRLCWERRFSIWTLTRCQGNYPPFGLLEWQAFMPALLPPPVDPRDWLHRDFVHALDETRNAWRTIGSGMQESGCYVVSPLIFPTRMLWMDCPDDGEALGITYSPTHVVPLRELRSHMR